MSDARGSRLVRPDWARESHRGAFPRDPSLANNSPDPGGTVGPETAPTTELAAPTGAEPVVVDAGALEGAAPTPKGFYPSAWAGWPSNWGTSWNNWGPSVGAIDPVMGRKVSTVFSCVELNSNALSSMPVGIDRKSVV